MASTERNQPRPLCAVDEVVKGVASIKRNNFYLKEWFELKGIASTKRNGTQQKKWFSSKQKKCHPTKEMVFL